MAPLRGSGRRRHGGARHVAAERDHVQQQLEESTFVYRYTSEAPMMALLARHMERHLPLLRTSRARGSVCWSFVSCFRVTMSCVVCACA